MLPLGHRPQLDGMRSIAVMMVAAYHWHDIAVRGVDLPLGFLGVGLFFVLSGYLITGILLNVRKRALEKGASRSFATRSFVARRMLRLLPALLLYLFVIEVSGFHGDPEGWGWHVFYLSNFRIYELGNWPANLGHLWSLSVEEQFYVVAPFATLFLTRANLKKLVIGLIATIVTVRLLVNLAGAEILPPWAFLGLLVGCWLALEAYEEGVDASWPRMDAFASRWPLLFLAYVSVGVLGTYADLPRQVSELNLFLAYLVMAALVWRGVIGFPGFGGNALNSRLMQNIGRVSYGAYLWHFFARELRWRYLEDLPELPLPVDFILMFAITVGLAQLSYHLCEKWFMALKDRFPYLKASDVDTENLDSATAGKTNELTNV
jgi:peptidoglycan/LPS O-acetylase OafA/YrhL